MLKVGVNMSKINKELMKFREFKKNYKFEQLELIEKNDCVYCGDIIVKDSEENIINESDDFINVGYKLKGPFSKVLSNLFPYSFVFKGKKVNSIEAVFQGIKFPNKDEQNLVLNYQGLDANNVKITSSYDWKKTGIIYWQGKGIDRFSKAYEEFCEELYISAIQNPLYRNVLKSTNKYIMHSIGEIDNKKTVFTRYEFEYNLNSLSSFLSY